MRKILLMCSLFFCFKSFGQPVVNRAGQANTVQDARWMGQYNLFVPRFMDTTAANLQKGVDSCGALIYTYTYNGFWFRQCSPKKWVQVFGNGSSASNDTLVWKLSGNTVGSRVATPVLGTMDANDLNVVTDGVLRFSVPSGGIVHNIAPSTVALRYDTITKQMYHGDAGGGGGNGIYGGSGSLPGNVTVTMGSNSLNFIGSGSQDATTLVAGDFSASVGDAARHGLIGVSQTSNGASFQLLSEAGIVAPITNEIVSVKDTAAATSRIDLYVSKPSVFQSKISINDTGINFQTNSLNRLKVTTAGNVGIGTTSPSFPLDVAGKVGINGFQMLYYPGSSFTGNLAVGNGLNNASTSGGGVNGLYNTSVGWETLVANTTGNLNVALGIQALRNNTTGYYNTALGANALYTNTIGIQNTAVGAGALQNNTDGSYNAAFGTGVLTANTTGQTNSGFGDNALLRNTTGLQNVAIGYRALQFNTIGYFNTATGYRSLESNTGGIGNTADGLSSLAVNTTGRYNTAVGFQAGGAYNRTDSADGHNIFIGRGAGGSVVTGLRNTALGSFTAGTSAMNNSILLGYGATGTASGQLVVSDSANRFTFPGISRGVANYVLTDSLGNGQYWVGRPNAALSLGLQNVITNDPILTVDNSIDLGGNNFEFGGGATTSQFNLSNLGGFGVNVNGSDRINTVIDAETQINSGVFNGKSSQINIAVDSIRLAPGLGSLNIDTLNNNTAQNQLMGWTSTTGADRGKVGYVTVGSGLSLSGGALSATGGGGGVTTMAAIGSSPNANGATISGSTLNLEPASASFGGVVTTVTQTFAGAKTFSSNALINGIDIGAYGGDKGFATSTSNLYFVASAVNSQLIFSASSGSTTMQVGLQGAGAYSENRLQYGGNNAYLRMGSNFQILGSAGYTGIGAAGTVDLLKIASTGQITLANYGSGTFTGTATKSLQVDAGGNVIEGEVGTSFSQTAALMIIRY